MAKRIIILILGLQLFCISNNKLNAINHPSMHCYARDASSIFYNGVKIEKAHAHSFKILGDGYAIDNRNVYYKNQVIEWTSPSSFKILSKGYAKDNINVYFEGEKVEGMKSYGFTISDNNKDERHNKEKGVRHNPHKKGGYIKDSESVFYNGVKIKGVKTYEFEIINDDYAKTPYRLYYQGEAISPLSHRFKLLTKGYASDGVSIYFRGEKVKGVHCASFSVLD